MNIKDNLFEAFSRLTLRMQEALPLERGLASILEEAHHLLPIDRFNILVADAEEKLLRSVASWGNLDEPLDQIVVPIDVRGGGLSKAYREGIEIVFNGKGPVPDDLRLAHPFSKIKAFRSRHFAILPLTYRGKAIGVLGADNKFSRRPIGPEDMAILRVFAAHVSTAIANARLFRETKEKAVRLQVLNRLSRTVASALDPQQVFNAVVEAATQLFEDSAANLWLIEGDGETLTLQADMARQPYLRSYTRIPMGQGLVGHIAQEKRPLLIDDVQKDPRVKNVDWHRAEEFHAFMGVPLLLGEKCLGTVAVNRRSFKTFDEEDADLLSALAGHATVAIQNARLYETTVEGRERAENLRAISEKLSSSLSIREVLQFTVEYARNLSNAKFSSIYLNRGGKFRTEVVAGEDEGYTANICFTLDPESPLGQGPCGQAARAKRPLLTCIPSDPSFAPWREAAARLGLFEELAVPLIVQGEVVGILANYSTTSAAFDQEVISLLSLFANHAAIAIQNARLFQEAQSRAEKLRALSGLSRTVTATLDLQQVFNLIIRASSELLSAPVASLWTLEGEELLLRAGLGLHSDLRVHRRFRVGEGMVGWIVEQKQPAVIPEFTEDPRVKNKEWAVAEGLRAFAGFPLLVGNRCLGVLTVVRKSAEPFGPEEVKLLTAFADQAAVAIENARLFQETMTRAERLRALTELSRAVTATLDLQKVFDFVVQASVELLNVAAARLWVVDETGKHIYLRAAGGDLGAPKGASTHFHVGEGAVGRAVESREILHIRDMQTDPRFKNKEWVIREGLVSALTVPLLHGDRALGALALMTRSERIFTEDEVSLVAAFANQAAIALDNARLYQELQVHSEHLEQVVQQRTEELRRRNIELEEANRHKSAFLATMSHELRTPLNAIIGFSELLVDRLFGDLNERQERYVQNVLQSGRHLLNLINDILDLSKVESGRMELRLEQVVLAHALDEAVNLIQSQAVKKGIAVEAGPWQDLPTISADPLRLRQILTNLLSNAVKFTPEGGRVVVATRTIPATRYRAAEVEIVVQDSGIGIREEDLERIFLPFVQVDASLARRHEGTGLGLALTRRLVSLHGGKIWAESQGEGKGARFVVRLPLQLAPQPGSN